MITCGKNIQISLAIYQSKNVTINNNNFLLNTFMQNIVRLSDGEHMILDIAKFLNYLNFVLNMQI